MVSGQWSVVSSQWSVSEAESGEWDELLSSTCYLDYGECDNLAGEFLESSAPYFRQSDTQLSSTVQRICALCILLPLPLLNYGWRVLLMALFGVISAVGAEALWNFISKQKQTVADMTAVETGLTCALLMPARAQYPLVIFAAASAMVIGKLPFGGRFRTPFIPAAVGFCLSAVCFPSLTFRYSQLSRNAEAGLPVFGAGDSIDPAFSQIALLRDGKNPSAGVVEFMLGEMAGPLGTASVVLLVIAAVWLLFTGNLAWQSAVSFLTAAAVISFIFPYHGITGYMYVIYDLLGGSTLFCCVFFAAYLNYCPKLAAARVIWGGLCGAIAVFIQHFGSVEAGGIFSVLIMTPFADAFDRLVWYCRSNGFTYRQIMRRISEKISYRMKTEQERELDEFKKTQ